MQQGMPIKVTGGCSALAGFAVALIAGLAADNSADVILSRGLVALVVCYAAGALAGAAAERAVLEALEKHDGQEGVEGAAGGEGGSPPPAG